MKLIYGLELPTQHKLLYLVREGGGEGGKIKMGDYRMKWRRLSVKQEAVMMFQYSGEVDEKGNFPWPDNDLSRLFGAEFYEAHNARTTPWSSPSRFKK